MKRRLKIDMITHVHRDIVRLLTTQPNQSITDLYLQMTASVDKDIVQGVIGNMRGLAQIYPSGEYRVGNTYSTKYSMGADGPFTFCAERLERKERQKITDEKSREKSRERVVDVTQLGTLPDAPPKRRERMFKSTRDEVKPVIPTTPSNWLTALGVK